MSMLDFALSIAGLPQDTINDLDNRLPGFARIVAAAKELEPIIVEAKPYIDKLLPLFAQAYPLAIKAWPDIVAVTPTVEALIKFANAKEG
jgi:hypothetical protein